MKIIIVSYSDEDFRVAIETHGIIIELPCIDHDSAIHLKNSLKQNIKDN